MDANQPCPKPTDGELVHGIPVFLEQHRCASTRSSGAVAHGPKFFEQATCHHRPEITQMAGDTEAKAATLLRDFFRARRQ